MKNTVLSRGPKGQFISSYFALEAWLPTLMKNNGIKDAVETVLNECAKGCLELAKEDYTRAAGNITDPESIHYARYRARKADEYLQKREIILQALVKIKTVGK